MNIPYKFNRFKDLVSYYINFPFKKKQDIQSFIKPQDNFVNLGKIATPNFQVNNNQWGMFKIPPKKQDQYKQLINEKGWIFETPKHNYGVIGYPSIEFDNNPINVNLINSWDVKYTLDLELEKYKKFNTSFDFWFSKGNTLNFNEVTHELMIWDDYFVATPFGKFIEEVKIGDSTYRIYSGFIDKTDEGYKGWEYIAFIRTKKTKSNSIDLKKILNHLMDRGILSSSHNLVSSQFGSEVFNASGKLQIKKFSYNRS